MKERKSIKSSRKSSGKIKLTNEGNENDNKNKNKSDEEDEDIEIEDDMNLEALPSEEEVNLVYILYI